MANQEDRVEYRAMAFVKAYYEDEGYSVMNVSKARGEHGGYDFFITKDDESLKIEVKGCTRPFGIPDPYHTEFDKDTLQLIADVLCVVYFIGDAEPALAVIPRSAIDPKHVTLKYGYRISSRFKNHKSISPYFVGRKTMESSE
jgi:hypothetical protein